MSAAPPKKDPVAVEAEVREKIHLEILKRTGAYHANDHVLLPSGQHTSEYIEKTLVTTEPSFTEGLGGVIAKHFAPWPIDVVVSTGKTATLTKEHMVYCLFRHTAVQLLRDVAVRVAQRSAGGGIARWLPVVGAVGVGAYAFYDTSQVAATAIELFEKGVVLVPADQLENLLPRRDSD